MHASAIEWGDVVMRLLGGGEQRDRDVAEWEACAAVCKRLEDYRPASFEAPDDWGARESQFLGGLRGVQDFGKLRDAVQEGMPLAFGCWRAHVTDHEAREASKLQTLVWVLRVLYRMRDRAPDEAVRRIDALASQLGDVLTLDWRCRTVPLEGDHRTWAIQCARRYDLLPKAWRVL